MIKQTKEQSFSVLIDQQEIGNRIWKVRFKNETIAQNAVPGQFVHISVAGINLDPLLRRPISISNSNPDEGWFEFIYREVGRGTKILAEMKPGQKLSIMGPLGKGFSLKGEKPLLIGGGMGVAPLIFLAEKLMEKDASIAIGGRTEAEVFWRNIFKNTCKDIYVSTDDGSCGKKGNALCLLEGLENQVDYVYTCGPEPLMKAVASWAKEHEIPCEVSKEKHMACGVGVCLSCACDTAHGRKKICLNGPVFPAEEVYIDE